MIILVILLAAILRFWNVGALMHFTLDEEIEAFIVQNIITGAHFPAIGVAVAPVGIHLTPWFYYLSSIPFWLGNLHPLSWGLTAATLGILTTTAIYFSFKEMFSKKIAFYSTCFYGVSFLTVSFDKHFWNVTPMPLVSVLSIFSLYQIVKGKLWWTVILAVLLSLGFSAHLSTITLLLLSITIWIKYKLPIFKKEVILGIIILLISFSPLVFFDLRHNFEQTKALRSFLTGEHAQFRSDRLINNLLLFPKTFSRLFYTAPPHELSEQFGVGAVQISGRESRISQIMILLSLAIFAYFFYSFWQKRKETSFFIYGWLIILTVLSLVIYGFLFKWSVFEFYLSLLFPSFCLIIAFLLDFLDRKRFYVLSIFLLGIFLFFNTRAVLTTTHEFGLSKKLKIIEWVKEQVGDRKYELLSLGVDHKYEGYRYLFERFYKAPQKSYADHILSWLYLVPPDDKADVSVILKSNEISYNKEIEEQLQEFLPASVSRNFGNIDVYIIEKND